MIHQQPTTEPPATQAHPVYPGRSSQEHTTSALSRVDVARLCERLDCLGQTFDELGISQPVPATASTTVSIESLINRIETLRQLFADRIDHRSICDDSQTTVLERTNHIN